MTQVVSSLFGGGAKGPSAAEKAAQAERERAAFEDRSEQDRLAALAANQSSRRQALSFQDQRKKATLG